MSCEGTFIRELRQRGFRMTPQREIVLSVMHQIEGFATAEEVHDRVTEVTSAVDISTVYRTLDLLKEFDIAIDIDAGEGRRRYRLLGVHGRHIHLVCRKCGKVTAAEMAPARKLAEQLKSQHGFVVDVDNLSLSGVCDSCLSSLSPA